MLLYVGVQGHLKVSRQWACDGFGTYTMGDSNDVIARMSLILQAHVLIWGEVKRDGGMTQSTVGKRLPWPDKRAGCGCKRAARMENSRHIPK